MDGEDTRGPGWFLAPGRPRMTPEELLDAVRRIMGGNWSSEEELDALIDRCEEQVPGGVTDLIYYSTPELTPEQVVEAALRRLAIEL